MWLFLLLLLFDFRVVPDVDMLNSVRHARLFNRRLLYLFKLVAVVYYPLLKCNPHFFRLSVGTGFYHAFHHSGLIPANTVGYSENATFRRGQTGDKPFFFDAKTIAVGHIRSFVQSFEHYFVLAVFNNLEVFCCGSLLHEWIALYLNLHLDEFGAEDSLVFVFCLFTNRFRPWCRCYIGFASHIEKFSH